MVRTHVFYRIVKASKGHPFAGMYAVEKIYIQGGLVTKKEIVKEWDLRILAESALARFGGITAYDEYVADNGEPDDSTPSEVVAPRDPKDLKLTKRTLSKELKFKPE